MAVRIESYVGLALTQRVCFKYLVLINYKIKANQTKLKDYNTKKRQWESPSNVPEVQSLRNISVLFYKYIWILILI